jgi:predicted permease
MEMMLADARFAIRTLSRSPGFVLVSILTLALGIGATLAIATLVNSVIIQSLPFRNPERLVRIYADAPKAGARDIGMSVPELLELQDSSRVFESVSAAVSANTALSGGDHVDRVELLGTSPQYFTLLGAKAALGRTYDMSDAVPGFSTGAVMSDALWRRQFGSDPRILGRQIRVDEDAYTVIGVMPPGFRHPGITLDGDVDLWLASGLVAAPFPSPPQRSRRFIAGVIARLKPGMTMADTQHRLDQMVQRLSQTYPNDYPRQQGFSLRLAGMQDSIVEDVQPVLLLLLAAASVVLLIVSVNIGGLMLARSATRSTEFAIRQAVGASRAQLIKLMLTESLLIALAGACVALLVLDLSKSFLLSLVPPAIPRLVEVQFDWKMVSAAMGLAIFTATVSGGTAAVRAKDLNANRVLREGGRTSLGTGRAHHRARALLVSTQVALAVVLLTAAGVLVRSFMTILEQDPGFNASHLIVGRIWVPIPNNPDANPYLSNESKITLDQKLLDQFATIPGVDAYAIGGSWDIPMSGTPANALPFSLPDESSTASDDHAAVFDAVSAGYFATLGIRVTRGREFTTHDDSDAPNTAVVNESFVRRFMPDRDPIGSRIQPPRGAGVIIVGVAADSRNSGLDLAVEPRVYQPVLQRPITTIGVFLRSPRDARGLGKALTSAVRTVDPELPVFSVRTMDEMMESSLSRRRFSLFLMGIFAITAAGLAALGIYGVIAFLVGQRTQEFGVRLALGAKKRDIFSAAVRPGVAMVLRGIGVGLVAALVVTRLLSSMLFGVSPSDPATLGGVAVLLVVIGVGASVVPALRAARLSPMHALTL